jgi:hypothetical protein
MEGAYLNLTVNKATGLTKLNAQDSLRVFCRIKLVGQEKETAEMSGTTTPEWNAKFKL